MNKLLACLGVTMFLAVITARAQLSPPNTAGVSMGHVHYYVRDLEANKKFWRALGAKSTRVGTTDVMQLPGVLIFLSQADAPREAQGSVVSHVAFKVESLAKLEADGFPIQQVVTSDSGVLAATLVAPAGDRLEFFDQRSSNLSFTIDAGVTVSAAGRPDPRSAVPIAAHHIHLYVPQGAESEAKAWYGKLLGGIPGKRWQYQAIDLPGINLNFSGSATPLSATKDRALDHIGFEVVNLQQFCQKLQAAGMNFDVPYGVQPGGFASAYLTDPWGTYIELTEGLNRLRVP